ncbi:hypothetical protein FOIG_07757 [Fusarium odoratissimum NRRL 54006]|uniref:Uncharacterized protein n=1 Tax=Fusarium odoratissimum (strain NRRL 54006) TaxID=1089451 RepID=X0JX13_FUSO5|nr:uncharacterized protein FOIG_07757 [Fusarium odoratissimum NRRL 54006]EXM00876.1 hypothetical protein FOIG_07757 [Fusarium odoratissimum NRRL 54006]
MALGKKPYPKATVKKIIKAHSNHNLKKNADVTVRLDVLMIANAANVYLLVLDLPRLRPIHGNSYQRSGDPFETVGRTRSLCEERQEGDERYLDQI